MPINSRFSCPFLLVALQVKVALAQAQAAERGEQAEGLRQQLRQAEAALDGARRQLRERDEDARSLVAGLEAALQATRTALEAEAARNKLKVQVRMCLLAHGVRKSWSWCGVYLCCKYRYTLYKVQWQTGTVCVCCVQELQRSLWSSQQQVKQLQEELAKAEAAREADEGVHGGPLGGLSEVALMQVRGASCRAPWKPPAQYTVSGCRTPDTVRRTR